MNIPEPRFEQYQLVTLHWNDKEYATKVIKRLYDLDEGVWMYELQGLKGLYSADSIDFRGD